MKFRVYLKNKKTDDFEGFMKVQTIETANIEEAKEEARKLESGGYKIYKIEELKSG